MTSIIVITVFSLLLTACPTRPDGNRDIIRYPYALSELFNVGPRAFAGRESVAGWLIEDTTTGLWNLAESGKHNAWNTTEEFYGVRMFNIDRELPLKSRLDVSEYDGYTFRYRTNMMNTDARMLDCMFWWSYTNEDYFPEWNWENGFANPDPELGYKEVIIPFHRMVKWGIPTDPVDPCNDTTKFNPMIFRNFRFDGRSPADDVSASGYWLEIVDFAFFKYP